MLLMPEGFYVVYISLFEFVFGDAICFGRCLDVKVALYMLLVKHLSWSGRVNLNKRSEIINKCRHRNKFALALYDSKDWIKFSFTAFEQPCLRDSHSFPKSDCFKSSWSQPDFGNRCFPMLVSLFVSHAYEITPSPSFFGLQLMWNESDYGR